MDRKLSSSHFILLNQQWFNDPLTENSLGIYNILTLLFNTVKHLDYMHEFLPDKALIRLKVKK